MNLKTVALAAFIITTPVAAPAAVSVFNFAGTINDSSDGTTLGAYNGQTFSGQISYDPSTAPSSVNGAQKLYNNAIDISYTGTAGSAAGTGYINISRLTSISDQTDTFGAVSFTTGDYYLAFFEIVLPGVFNAPSLPTDLTGLAFNLTTQGSDGLGRTKGFSGSGTVLAAPASAVPEPATWAMMIGGFGMVGGTLRRRQRVAVRFA